MPTIQASEFKAKCRALRDQVARTGETLVVTKNGKPIAELRPHRQPRSKSLMGLHDDPAERFIAASALVHGATLMTADERLLEWQHAMDRHDARK